MKASMIIALAAFGLAALLGGAQPFGRILMSLGLPALAADVFRASAWKGAAAFRAGDYDRAARAFAEADDAYNLGNAEVRAGRYAAALEAYDRARNHREDPSAEANFDLVVAYYAGLAIDADTLGLFSDRKKDGPAEESFVARGDARAAGSGSEATNVNTMLGLVELDSRGRLGVRRIFDDAFIRADKRWLEQLEDVPGEFMSARIAAEHKRRKKLGLSPPEPDDPR